MEFKFLLPFLFLGFVTRSSGFTLNNEVKALNCNAAYGAIAGNNICGILSYILSKLEDRIVFPDPINITFADIDPSLTGHLNLENGVIVDGIKTLKIDACAMSTASIIAPLAAHLGVSIDLQVKADYDLDTTILIPLSGKGAADITIGVSLVVDTDLSFCPYENPLAMETFDYALSLNKAMNIKIDGLDAGKDLVEGIIKLLNADVKFGNSILGIVDKLIHKNVTAIVPSIANPLLEASGLTPCRFLGCDERSSNDFFGN